MEVRAASVEDAEPELRPLQVDEDADRAARLLFERANHRHALAHDVVRSVAHIDAKDVSASGEQGGDGLAVARGGAEGGDDLDATATGLHLHSSHNRRCLRWRLPPRLCLAPRRNGEPTLQLKGLPGRSVAPSSS